MSHIKKIKQSTINRALRLHKIWLNNGNKGKRLKVTTDIFRLMDFSRADFSDANFYCADFSDANFSDANFYCADFSRANFYRANFSRANFYCADFSDADFSDANFKGIKLNWVNTINLMGITVISCQLNTSDENRSIQFWRELNIVTAGCFNGTLEELKERVREVHSEDSVIYKKYQVVFNYIDAIIELEEVNNDSEV